MEHCMFKPKQFQEGQHAVVGDCNGIPMEKRWEIETPLFAEYILNHLSGYSGNALPLILDYGCGVGRLAKEVLKKPCTVWGVDTSLDMLNQATAHVNNPNFHTSLPRLLPQHLQFNLIYCVYVLQHAPAIELREILSRIYHRLKDDGIFVFCSSEYRMCIRYDNPQFFDDRFLGVNIVEEISRYFEKVEDLFPQTTLDSNPILKTMIQGDQGGLPHPAYVYRKKKLTTPYFDAPLEGAVEEKSQVAVTLEEAKSFRKLLLVNRLAPGDILVMTNALRDLHKTYPGEYQTDVRTPCNEIFNNNPYNIYSGNAIFRILEL